MAPALSLTVVMSTHTFHTALAKNLAGALHANLPNPHSLGSPVMNFAVLLGTCSIAVTKYQLSMGVQPIMAGMQSIRKVMVMVTLYSQSGGWERGRLGLSLFPRLCSVKGPSPCSGATQINPI